MHVTWFGHAGFMIKDGEKTILIDPWFEGNPVAPSKDVLPEKVDIVFVTHDHGDHGYKDGIEVCKKTGATFVSIFELANKAKADGVQNVVGGNIGGTAEVELKRISAPSTTFRTGFAGMTIRRFAVCAGV